MVENRRHRRYSLDTSGIVGKMLFATEVRILDMSSGGALLSAGRRFEIGREYSLKLEHEDGSIPLKGIVIWSVLREFTAELHGKTTPLYEAGIQFSAVSSDALLDLERFIRDHGVEAVKGGRTHRHAPKASPHPRGTAVVDASEECIVRRLSVSGMLIETAYELEIGKRMSLEISLPGNRQIASRGRVTFCINDPKKGKHHFDVGIEFVEMATADTEKLKKHFDVRSGKRQHATGVSVRIRTAG